MPKNSKTSGTKKTNFAKLERDARIAIFRKESSHGTNRTRLGERYSRKFNVRGDLEEDCDDYQKYNKRSRRCAMLPDLISDEKTQKKRQILLANRPPTRAERIAIALSNINRGEAYLSKIRQAEAKETKKASKKVGVQAKAKATKMGSKSTMPKKTALKSTILKGTGSKSVGIQKKAKAAPTVAKKASKSTLPKKASKSVKPPVLKKASVKGKTSGSKSVKPPVLKKASVKGKASVKAKAAPNKKASKSVKAPVISKKSNKGVQKTTSKSAAKVAFNSKNKKSDNFASLKSLAAKANKK